MKKVAVITGVTSFLGKSTAKYLLSKGFIVFGIVRPDSKKKDNIKDICGLKVIEIDFNNLNSRDFDDFISSHSENDLESFEKVDISFIHFGWGSTLDRENFTMQMLNVDYSMKVLEFARFIKAKRFIFAGSQAEYSDIAYGMAKRKFSDDAKRYLKNTDMNFIHFKIFSIYGKEDRENSLIKELVRCCKADKDIKLSSCNYKWNFLYIDDFTKVVFEFIKNDVATDDFDIASDDTRLLKDYCESVKAVFKSKSNLKFGARLDSKEHFAIPNISKMKEILPKMKFTRFEKGVLNI